MTIRTHFGKGDDSLEIQISKFANFTLLEISTELMFYFVKLRLNFTTKLGFSRKNFANFQQILFILAQIRV